MPQLQHLRMNRVLALGFCSVTFFFGGLAMAGWIWGKPSWRSFLASGSEMKANAALCLMMLGLAMALRTLEPSSKVLQRISTYLAVFNGIIAGATLIEYAFGANLRIDELFFVDSSTIGTSDPGRMSPPSAASLLLGSFAVMLLRWNPRWMIRIAQSFALAMAFVPTHILMSYAYGNMNVLAFGSRRSYMAVPTALALLSMAVSVLLYAPDRSLMRTLTARSQASRVFRWLLVGLLLLPPAIGWFVLTWLGGSNAPPEFGVATTVMLSIVFLAALAWLNATRLNRAEEALRDSERMQRLLAQIGEAATRVPETGRLTETIAELVAKDFHVSRCGFARVNLQPGELAAQYDYHGSLPELSGVLPMSQYADHLKADGFAGRTTVISDLSVHPGTAAAYDNTFKAMRVRAHISVPLYRDGKWVASFWVSHHEPRRWNASEVETLQIIADRVWLVIQQARMEEKATWLASFPQQNPNPVVEVEVGTGIIHYVNTAAEILFPQITQEGVAHPFLAGVLDLLSSAATSPKLAVNREIMVGDAAYAQTISFVRETNRLRVYSTDITLRKRAENALRESEERLRDRALHLEELVRERTAKLTEAVNELESWSYSIAHDMRAPLRAMHGFSALLEQNYSADLDSTGKSYVQRITASATRLDRLIQDVLNYSKVARADLQLHAVDLESLFREIIESYPALQPPKAHISIKTPLPPVLGNTAALTQVLSNLLGNAVKFARNGVEPRVSVFAENHDDIVRLSVEDNGIGIPQESQARIFQIFQRLHPASEYEGTGIGLAIVRKAVERMGGTVGVESEAGKGSRFWVQLRRG